MAYLIYGIMKTPVVPGEPLAGVRGQALSVVCAAGLAAAVAELPSAAAAPPVAELLAYSRAVAELHRRQAVIPMRYGCFLEDESAIQRLLVEKRGDYTALLGELEGRVEMGVRILLTESVATAAAPPPAATPRDGSQYLATRREFYRVREASSLQYQALLDRCSAAFAGLYTQHRTETGRRDGLVVLSLYFLVPQEHTDGFRETFRRQVEQAGPKALLSGPWPPYNFATPEHPLGAVVGADDEQRRQRHDD
jgi:hypothetical protein